MQGSERRQLFIRVFSSKTDQLLNNVFLPEKSEDDWQALLAKRLEQTSTLVTVASATVTVAAVAAPITGGLSLAAAGGILGAAGAGIVLAQAANGWIQVMRKGKDDDASSYNPELITKAKQMLWLRGQLAEVAEIISIEYSHFIQEVIHEKSIIPLANDTAERVMKKVRENLREQLKTQEHTTPNQLLNINVQEIKKYLEQRTQLSVLHNNEKVALNEQYAPKSLLCTNELPAKWVYSRSRMAFYKLDSGRFSVTYYASAEERMYLTNHTTLSQYGYHLEPAQNLQGKQITGQNPALVPLDELDLPEHVQQFFCIEYAVTAADVTEYLSTIANTSTPGIPISLNDYLSNKLGVRVIATCHDDTLKGISLRGGNYTGVNFRRAHLEKCDLTDTIWDYAQLMGAYFAENPMENASFRNAKLQFTHWLNMTLTGDFSYSVLHYATMMHVKILTTLLDIGCQWDGAELFDVQRVDQGKAVAEKMETFKDYFEARFKESHEEQIKQEEQWKAWHHQQEDHWAEQAQLNEEFNARLTTVERAPIEQLLTMIRKEAQISSQNILTQPHVDLYVSSSSMVSKTTSVWERLEQQLKDPNEMFLILTGETGAGKTETVDRWVLKILSEFETEENWLAIKIKLKHVQDHTADNFLEAALKTKFSAEQITLLKENFQCLIIFDGLDECGINFTERYIFEECLASQMEWMVGFPKFILTAQNRLFLETPHYRDYLRFSSSLKFPYESECIIQPLNEQQITEYLTRYYPIPTRQSSESDLPASQSALSNYIQHFYIQDNITDTRLKDILVLAQSPIMLHIICEVLHQGDTLKLPTSRMDFYDEFVNKWFEHVKVKAPQEHFTPQSIQFYLQGIAYQMFTERKRSIERPFADEVKDVLQLELDKINTQHDTQSLDYLFDNPLFTKARNLSPLRVTLKTDALPVMICYEFENSAFEDYALAKKLFNILERSPENQRLTGWNYAYLTIDSPGAFDFLEELITKHPQRHLFEKSLLQMIAASKGESGAQWSKAASNAITLFSRLIRLQQSVSNIIEKEAWQEIHIANAHVTLDLTNISLDKSDCYNVCFIGSILAGTRFNDANMEKTRFLDATSLIHINSYPRAIAVYPADEPIIAYDAPKVIGSSEHKIMVVGLNGMIYPELEGHQQVIYCMCWGIAEAKSQGTQEMLEARLASGSAHGTIRVWRINNQAGDEIAKLKCEKQLPILSLSFCRTAKYLASGGEDRTVRIWDIDKKTTVFVYQDQHVIYEVALGQQRSLLFAVNGQGQLRIWTLTMNTIHYENAVLEESWTPEKTEAERNWNKHEKVPSTFSPSASHDTEEVTPPPTAKVVEFITEPFYCLALSPRENAVAIGCENGIIYIRRLRGAQFSDLLLGHHDVVSALLWNSRCLVSGSHDSTIRIWNPENGLCISILQGDGSCIRKLAWLSGGRQIIAGQDRMLSIWNMEQATQFSTCMEGMRHFITCIAPYGNRVATGHVDGSLWLWTIKPLTSKMIDINPDAHATQMAWSHDGGYLALLDKQHNLFIKPVDEVTDTPWVQLQTAAVHAMCWLNDTLQLLIADKKGITQLWGFQQKVWQEQYRWIWQESNQEKSIEFLTSKGQRFVAASGTMVKGFSLDPILYPFMLKFIHTRNIVDVIWSPNGVFLACLDDEQAIMICDIKNLKIIFKETQRSAEKQMLWTTLSQQDWFIVSTSEEIRFYNTTTNPKWDKPDLCIPSGADRIAFHAPYLYLIQKKNIDVIDLRAWLNHDSTLKPFVARMGQGLCVRECDLRQAKNLDQETKAVLKTHGALVASESKKTGLLGWFNLFNTDKVAQLPAPVKPSAATLVRARSLLFQSPRPPTPRRSPKTPPSLATSSTNTTPLTNGVGIS